MKLLMHVCCAPCSVYCIDNLRKEGIEPTLYWFNPNIHPYIEYKTRRDTVINYAKSINVKAIIDDNYGLEDFCKNTVNSLKSRCADYCYPIRLTKTFEYAKEHGYDAVTTTLLYSVYQKHDFIKKYMEDLSKRYGIKFLYRDFRLGFIEGQEKSRELGLYMQKYCGCIFSEKERYLDNQKSSTSLPEGFEFPKKRPIEIKREKGIDTDKYLLLKNDKVICESTIKKIDEKTVELLNIQTISEMQNKGYAKMLLKYLIGNCKQKYEKMVVGCTPDRIPFFTNKGFDQYIKTNKDINNNEKIYYFKQLK